MEETKIKYLKLKDIIQIVLIILVVSYFLKLFAIDTLRIPTSSMEKTLLPGDLVIVNKFYYALKVPKYLPLLDIELKPIRIFSFNKPKKGDVIAFYLSSIDDSNSKTKTFVKRCIGLPGDSVIVDNVKCYLPKRTDRFDVNKANIDKLKDLIVKDGNTVDVKNDSVILINGKNVDHYVFQNNFYYFIGDNYSNSIDSRNFGPIPEKDLIGKVVLIYWSVNMDNLVKNFIHKIRWERLGILVW